MSRRARTTGRLGTALALTGAAVVGFASFGSLSYAARSAPSQPRSPAAAQYGPAQTTTAEVTTTQPAEAAVTTTAPATTTQPTTTTKQPTTQPPRTTTAAGGIAGESAPPTTGSTLPFTGLALWVPLLAGMLLVLAGVGLRLQARRR